MESIIMAKILVTGSNGQLGSEIKALHVNYPQYDFIFTCKDDLDITCKDAITSTCKANQITHIINCAAYTAVDKAQGEEALAEAINHQGARNLAFTCKELDISLVHISTDYVFDGKHYKPYTPKDTPNPQGVYGQTKLKGEEAIKEIAPSNTIIIRTSWVYSAFGNNFVKTMLRLGKERESLNVVYDQVGTPTYAKDLAKALLDIIPHIKNNKPKIYHYSNEGVLSWYDFAKEIMRMAKLPCKINPIPTTDYPTPAPRPHYSLLNKSDFKTDFNITIAYWKDSLDKCLKELGERK
jgi:dTDP-4-dehydrorhamnose reductase